MLSILIPVYNYNAYPLVSELHKQCLECGINFEILVFNDGGTQFENENLKIREFVYCTYISSSKNIGRTQARNTLSNSAKFQSLLFLDADVIPSTSFFIKNYLHYITESNYDVLIGGCSYKIESMNENNHLRFYYGTKREQQSAVSRNQKKYVYILSGNMLIKKNVFESVNYKDATKYYGMDIFLSYNLMINRNTVYHIDNNIYHLGLENDAVFFEKCLSSVKSRKETLLNMPRIEEINSLIKYYKILNRFKIIGLAKLFFLTLEPLLKKLILKKNPYLVCLDLYRLGYMSTLK
ncbi:MAG: hypothetical protein C0412_07535 [Flavobacterium sp.]|nr:hypothetical protein [Flavobacterium sp.]